MQPAGQRAQTIAEYFQNVHWASAELDDLPDRTPLYPQADIPEHTFTADELRAAKPCLKSNRSAGTDTVESEFMRAMLGTAFGFMLLLSILCNCWTTRSMPTAFDLARIVAVYKEKGDPGDADNYRPIALLQVC